MYQTKIFESNTSKDLQNITNSWLKGKLTIKIFALVPHVIIKHDGKIIGYTQTLLYEEANLDAE
jgi:hypothetical protein